MPKTARISRAILRAFGRSPNVGLWSANPFSTVYQSFRAEQIRLLTPRSTLVTAKTRLAPPTA
jgi:hypothetical protein